MRHLIGFLTQHDVGRWITIHTHRFIHPGINHPLRFESGGCWLCNRVVEQLLRDIPRDAVEDASRITLSEAEYDDDGNLVKRGVYMSASARRQLEEIMAKADPDKQQALMDAIEEIRKDPSP